MTADEVKAALGAAARRCWPDVKKASGLPFPDYWKAVTEWLTFHAPHIGDALVLKLIDDFAVSAKDAEVRGVAPVPPKLPDKVKEIWAEAGANRSIPAQSQESSASTFGAPFIGPRPGALKRTQRTMEQGRLGTW